MHTSASFVFVKPRGGLDYREIPNYILSRISYRTSRNYDTRGITRCYSRV